MQQMQQQMQHQAAVASSPGASSIAASSASSAPRFERGPRISPPQSFDGKSSALDEWIVELNQQFEWYGTNTEAERIRFATMFLKGAARDWWMHLPSADKNSIVSWTQLTDSLRKRFQPVTTAEMARAKLSSLAQGKSNIHEYVAAFRRLIISLPSMEEGDKLFAFVRGLKSAIATQIRVQGITTVDSAIELAVRVGSLGEFAAIASAASGSNSSNSGSNSAPMELDAIEGLESESTNDTNGNSNSNSVTRAEFQQLLAAMQDRRAPNKNRRPAGGERGGEVRSPRFQVKGLTPEQVRSHLDANTCFGCGSKDHQSRNCPAKQPGK